MNDEELFEFCKQQYIKCDAKGCEKSIAGKGRCSSCHLVFYCSRDCQKQHWKEHKPCCWPINERKEMYEEEGKSSGAIPQVEADTETRDRVLSENPSCAICLQEGDDIVQPIVLGECKHVFCFSCLKHWNNVQTKSSTPSFEEFLAGGGHPELLVQDDDVVSTCPICRKEIPNIRDTIISETSLLLAAAKNKNATEELRSVNCSRALENVKKLADYDEWHDRAQVLLFKTEIYTLQKDYENALKIGKEAVLFYKKAVDNHKRIKVLKARVDEKSVELEVDEEIFRILDEMTQIKKAGHTAPDQHIASIFHLADIQLLGKDWIGALQTYRYATQLYSKPDQMTAKQYHAIYSGTAQCQYELGEYSNAIIFGEAALKMNRYFPWAHKYVVLAYKATGQLEKAKEAAGQAVVYEAPWDDQYRAKVCEF